MPETAIMDLAKQPIPFPDFLAPAVAKTACAKFAAADIVSAMKDAGFRDLTEKRLSSVQINGTFIEVLETASGSACAQCPFAMSDPMPHSPPICCKPDYLACHAGIRFRLVETAKGVPS